MCLLINQKKGHSFSYAWLKDFYSFNPDGIGVMYADKGMLHTVKTLPKTENELINFYTKHVAGKDCSLHFRWRTHGDTDLLNCHPYEVFNEEDGYPIQLMHNGVLASGNAKDTTKSDTWHYIQDIIRPALKADPTQFMSAWFKTLIEDNIGRGNKFVMMDSIGNRVTFNEDAGVEFQGCWLSNTYAWSAADAGFGYKYGTKIGSKYSKSIYEDDDDTYDWRSTYGYGGTSIKKPTPVLTIGNTTKDPASKFEDEQLQTYLANNGLDDDYKFAEYDEEAAEADSFAEEFLEAIYAKNMFVAYNTITEFELIAFYIYAPDEAYNLLTLILDDQVTQDDVIEHFELNKDLYEATV